MLANTCIYIYYIYMRLSLIKTIITCSSIIKTSFRQIPLDFRAPTNHSKHVIYVQHHLNIFSFLRKNKVNSN